MLVLAAEVPLSAVPSMLVLAMLRCPSALCARNTSSHCAQALEMLRSCPMI